MTAGRRGMQRRGRTRGSRSDRRGAHGEEEGGGARPSLLCMNRVLRLGSSGLGSGALALLVYGVVAPALEPFHVDHAWYASVIHAYVVRGVEADTVFGLGPATGAFGGTLLFGKVFSAVSGAILGLVGWSHETARLLASAYHLLSLPLWFHTARLMGMTRSGGILLVALLAVAKPCVFASSVLRPETFITLLTAAVIVCALRGWQGSGALLAACAVETHPIGIIAPLTQVALLLLGGSARRGNGGVARAAAGLGAGAGIYLLLHGRALAGIAEVATAAGQGDLGRFFLLSYLFAGKVPYRLLEVIVVALAGWTYLRRGGLARNRDVASLGVAALLFALLPLRGNPHYIAVVYPAALVLLACAAELSGRRRAVLLGAGAYFAAILLAGAVRHGSVAAARDRYQAAIAAVVPRDGAAVVGSPEEWWVFKDRPYYVAITGRETVPTDLWESYHVVVSQRLFERYRLSLPEAVLADLGDQTGVRVQSLRTELTGETLVYTVTRSRARASSGERRKARSGPGGVAR